MVAAVVFVVVVSVAMMVVITTDAFMQFYQPSALIQLTFVAVLI
jgi:hypothetical protein